ncbi:type I-G CRISPR-associated helicase/endonuclease Cas3g [Planctomicrobium sp. SH527]|uniref:type I-G CRISPR-associated helicase/endonuclease Cas3g n=1 Tax=Planctomicrobium sp. SH527 TaxID=3448123 RepID=UPI003F5AE396
MSDFETLFQELTGYLPFPWQRELYQRFLKNDPPEICNLPTGLGKTSVIPIWLIALAEGAKLPRRLAYVVNRRTVVDQTTDDVESLRRRLLNDQSVNGMIQNFRAKLFNLCALPTEIPLGISTLRGEFADNQEWAADPARPAVICGTVDMIGSRLLFSGYRIGFRSRPLHAGFLGQDTLIVHDESQLEPAFQTLLTSIRVEQLTGRSPDTRPIQIMELSAISKRSDTAFKLTAEDRNHPIVRSRLMATKQLRLHSIDDEKKKLAERLTELALRHSKSGEPVLIFARTVEVVEQVAAALAKKLPKDHIATLTGTMRGLERDQLAKENGVFLRFLSPGNRPADQALTKGTVYLVCTSAGEVGVNLSAHHLVCDLSTYESMAQRFGRVNRFGTYDDTQIDVVHPAAFVEDDKLDAYEVARKRTLTLLEHLKGDASPSALECLNQEDCTSAYAPIPLQLPTSDILFDSWALTSITDKLPGRPPVDEYLHGIPTAWERPRTSIAWREEVQILWEKDREDRSLLELLNITPDELLEEYPVKPHEILQDDSGRIFDKLKKIAARCDFPVWVTDREGTTHVSLLSELVGGKKEDFDADLVLLPPHAGGLNGGMLDALSLTANDVADKWTVEIDGQTIPRRMRLWTDDERPKGMRLVRTIEIRPHLDDQDATHGADDSSEDQEESPNRTWKWYVRPASADDEGSKTATFAVPWEQHTSDVCQGADAIGRRLLGDDPELADALSLAASLHDLGKRRTLWQQNIGNPNPACWYAKSGLDPVTKQIWQPQSSSRYRHEFGSLMDVLYPNTTVGQEQVEIFERVQRLSPVMKDVVLHLVAAHHGRARPHFAEEEAFDPDRGLTHCDQVASEIPQRFARLQRRYGRWGLAWLESLLRAADIAASRQPGLSIQSAERQLEEV